MTKFNVNFAVDDMEGKTVLVFLKPQNPQRNYQVHAWQVLAGLAGSSESFLDDDVIGFYPISAQRAFHHWWKPFTT